MEIYVKNRRARLHRLAGHSGRGKNIFCRILAPKESRKTFPAILVVHGFKGDSSERHIEKIAGDLSVNGFITIRPDLTENPGNSYLPISEATYGQELSDLEDVLDYLLEMPQVDSGRIGITGHSLGGMIVAQLTAKRREIKALATLSAVYSFESIAERIFKKPFDKAKEDFEKKGWTGVWSQGLKKELKIKRKFYEDIFLRSADTFAKEIRCPTLIISSGSDESVSQIHADNYLKNIASEKKRMKIIEGADHIYRGDALNKVSFAVCDWFGKFLLES